MSQLIPFAVRLRARRAFESTRPRHFAIGPPRNELHDRYQRWYRDQGLRRFLRPFVTPGDLVFDGGANVGEWTFALRGLGCRVVAVEPQDQFASVLADRRAGDPLVELLRCALGRASGEQELFVGAQAAHASTSRSYIERMTERAGYTSETWSGSHTVPVRTLDDLVAEFGVPELVKLDIEGAEPDALEGLSHPVKVVVFETHGETPEDVERIVSRLAELGDYAYNLTPGEFPRLQWERWGDGSAATRAVESDPHGWNNVVACLADQLPAIRSSRRRR